MLRALALAAVLTLAACASTPTAPTAQSYATAVADAGRPAADTARDAARKPAETLAFAGIRPGQTVAELLPGGGYFTRLLSKAVGPTGRVIALVPASAEQTNPDQVKPVRAIAADPAYGNVTLETPTGALLPSVQVDVVFTAQNYHDVHAYFGAEAVKLLNAALYAKLNPGGTYFIIDHAAAPGAGTSVARSLHRIDVASVKAEVPQAGFVLDGESAILANPADPHTAIVFDPSIRGQTDQFMLRFKKPG